VIEIQRASDGPAPADSLLVGWAERALQATGRDGDITLRLVDASESQTLNRAYRDKNKPTNVLSFPFEMPEGLPADAMSPLLGDIIVCAGVVAQEAAEQGKALDAHWAHMIIHGVLHLLGHDHQDDDEAAQMEALETTILHGLGFADPYLETGPTP